MMPRRTYRFFTLVFALSVPFWVLGSISKDPILPGLPSSALMVLAPAVAALLLVYKEDRPRAVRRFLMRLIDCNKMTLRAWGVSLGTMPAVMIGSGVWLNLGGQDLPAQQIDPSQVLLLFGVFLIAAMAEELGWTAFATRSLCTHHGWVLAGSILGVVTVLWHIIPLIQVGRTWDWIWWWALGSFARRILILWLYVRGGYSVFSASLFHAMSNVSWMMFPVQGSHFNPPSVAIILCAIVLAVLTVEARSLRSR